MFGLETGYDTILGTNTMTEKLSNLTNQFTYDCPCFQKIRVTSAVVSNSGNRTQTFSCRTCNHPIDVTFTHNELGAAHFFNSDHSRACHHYTLAFQANETTPNEYIFNLHESLNLWSRPNCRERLETSEATQRLNAALELCPNEEKPTLWFEDNQIVQEMKQQQDLFEKEHADKIVHATEESGLTRDEAMKKVRKLLKKLRKIRNVRTELADGVILDVDLKDEQRVMLDSEMDVKAALKDLDDIFEGLL